MRLVVHTPARTIVDETVSAVGADGAHGTFTMLPRHLDHAVLLEAGILSFRHDDGSEGLLAVDGGVLVKVGDDVRVATPRAIPGDRLEALREAVARELRTLDEHQRASRAALARVEGHVLESVFEFEADDDA